MPRFPFPDEDPNMHYFVNSAGDTAALPRISGGLNQNFASVTVLPPIANLTAVTATTETGLWLPSGFTPIAGNDPFAGKIYKVTAGGIMSWAATGTLVITPRYGLTTGGITMGANPVAQTTPGATTNAPWLLEFYCIFRTIGATGSATSTCIGTGKFISDGVGTLGTGTTVAFGGTSATVDSSAASGIFIGWTLSVAGTNTPQYAFIQSLN